MPKIILFIAVLSILSNYLEMIQLEEIITKVLKIETAILFYLSNACSNHSVALLL